MFLLKKHLLYFSMNSDPESARYNLRVNLVTLGADADPKM